MNDQDDGSGRGDVVIDTNVVLDLWVFREPAFYALRQALQAGARRWLATPAMRVELVRVLGYPNVARYMVRQGLTPDGVLAEIDTHLVLQAPALAAQGAALQCHDRDDQIFIDLALAHRVPLISRDKEVLRLAKALAAKGVRVSACFPEQPLTSDG